MSSPGSFLAAENLVLPVVPRLRFARGVLPRGSLQRQQPGRPVPPLQGASVHQGSRWSLAFSSGVRDVCAESSLFWFPRLVCLSEGLALPPTGFGCRELFIRSVSFRFRRCLRRRSPAAPGPSPTGAQRPYTVSSWARDVGRGEQCWWRWGRRWRDVGWKLSSPAVSLRSRSRHQRHLRLSLGPFRVALPSPFPISHIFTIIIISNDNSV